ncbi:hypothetical protein ACFQZ8_22000, partial [Micromonospora azadirachtae]
MRLIIKAWRNGPDRAAGRTGIRTTPLLEGTSVSTRRQLLRLGAASGILGATGGLASLADRLADTPAA